MATDGMEELQEEGKGKKQMGLRPSNHHHPGVCFSHLCLGVNHFKVIHFWHSRAAELSFLLLYEALAGISC